MHGDGVVLHEGIALPCAAKELHRSTPPVLKCSKSVRLLSTLIALVDSGVDLTDTADSPYYNFTNAYDAYNQETAAQYGDSVVQDTSLQHGHGSTVADLIVAGIQAAESQPGAG